MIIECPNCNKKFEVNSELIPSSGRTIQCSSCNHVWFFKKNTENLSKTLKSEIHEKISISPTKDDKKIKSKSIKSKNEVDINVKNNKSFELTRYKKKPTFTFTKFLAYILVFIVTFAAFLIVLDTFKSPLYKVFPSTEFIILNFYETLKDIILFIKDLI